MTTMSRTEFDAILTELNLTQGDVARMMRVATRTVRRWAARPEKMYGPAREALRAWVKCNRNGLDWGDVIGGRRLCEAAGLPWIPPRVNPPKGKQATKH